METSDHGELVFYMRKGKGHMETASKEQEIHVISDSVEKVLPPINLPIYTHMQKLISAISSTIVLIFFLT